MSDQRGFSVIYEDNHLLIVNKANGILVQGDETGDTPLVELGKEYIKEKYQKPGAVFLGTVHRLDQPVSGVVVFARTSKSLKRMNALFREKETKKTYWAVVKQTEKGFRYACSLVAQRQKEKQDNDFHETNVRRVTIRTEL